MSVGKMFTTKKLRRPSPGSPFLIVAGEGISAMHPLPEDGEVIIGRAAESTIAIDHDTISRRHALLRLGPELTIEDLGSANGTRLRGEQLAPGAPVPLASGELIELGSLVVVVQRPPRPARTLRLRTHETFEALLEEECNRGGPLALVRLRAARELTPAELEEIVAPSLGESDALGVYGAGEYEILLSGADVRAAERVTVALGAVDRIAGPARVGSACAPRDGRTADELFQRAAPGPARARTVDDDRIVVADPAMQALHELIARVAPGTISVLILGETGVGKEVVAESIHRASPRARGPLLRLSCAALPETLLEAELFGNEKGAFTGAVEARPGLLETADGGTVFLDEIGELPLGTQAKLLRVLEDRLVVRVGGRKAKAIDVRFVSATNRDLEREVAAGQFREDLYYRLNGVVLVVPPLRDRPSELEPLARTFATRAAVQLGRPAPTLSPGVLARLRTYSWPGNIRELRNTMERAVLLGGTTITEEHLPVAKMRATLSPTAPAAVPDERTLRASVADVERERILEVLEQCAGNQTRAARVLGMSRTTLAARLDEYRVPRPRK